MIIALTGFMASGKSTFGRAAAQILGWKFIDLDDCITERFGSVSEIFAQGGEALFRVYESEVLSQQLETEGDILLALGGGTILSRENLNLVKKNAGIIWLDTSFDIIMSELSGAERPLVKEKSADEIRALYDLRRPIYSSAADVTFVVDDTDYGAVISRLAETVSKMADRPFRHP